MLDIYPPPNLVTFKPCDHVFYTSGLGCYTVHLPREA